MKGSMVSLYNKQRIVWTIRAMKVLFLLTYYYPHWTGLTEYARRLAEGLAQKKFSVSVLTTQHRNDVKSEERINGVLVRRTPVWFRLSRTLVSPLFIFAFFKHIQQNDAIIVYLPFAEVLLVAILAKIYHKKLFLVHNGDLVLPKGFLNRCFEWIYFVSTSLSMRLSDAIIIQTTDYALHSRLLSQHKKKWEVILPLYEIHAPDSEVIKKWKKQYGLEEALVGFAGRFVEEKGCDVLLQAIPLVTKVFPKVQFVFAGDTKTSYEDFFSQQKGLIDRNKKYIVFLGTLDQKEMASFYDILDVFVIPSRTDCFPSTEGEALLDGTPVIVTDIPGARWPAQKIKGNCIVQANDSSALAQGIIAVLREKEKYTVDKKEAAAIFDYDKTLKQYMHLLQ